MSRDAEASSDATRASRRAASSSPIKSLTRQAIPGYKPAEIPRSEYGTVESVEPLPKPIFKSRLRTKADGTKELPLSRSHPTEMFSLEAMLGFTHTQDPISRMVSGGVELTKLGGLDLNRAEPSLHSQLLSPWADDRKVKESVYFGDQCNAPVPAAYKRVRVCSHPKGGLGLSGAMLAKMTSHSLFYMFYAMPNDFAQLVASEVLYDRNWAYHCQRRLWLSQRVVKTSADGSTPQSLELVYFDPVTWRCRALVKDHSEFSWQREGEHVLRRKELERWLKDAREEHIPVRYFDLRQPVTGEDASGGVAVEPQTGHCYVSVHSRMSADLPQTRDTIFGVLSDASAIDAAAHR